MHSKREYRVLKNPPLSKHGSMSEPGNGSGQYTLVQVLIVGSCVLSQFSVV